MSKKTLLKESTIRQFMKYANIGGLAENFISDTYGEEEVVEEAAHEDEEEVVEEAAHEEKPMEEGAGHYMEDEEGMADMADDLPADDDMGMDDEAEMADTSEASVEALVDALADTITQVTGVEVTAAGDVDAELPGDEGPMDDMADAPMGDEAPMGGEEDVLDETEVIDEEAVIEETMKRVMTRLQGMKKEQAEKEELIEAVAAAVEKRLASK
jgi:hypothetical protein